MSENPVGGRPWSRGAVLDKLVRHMEDHGPKEWGVRELARATEVPRSSAHDALVLGESIRPEDYTQWGGDAPRDHQEKRGRPLRHAEGEGVVRRHEGSWYLHSHEDALAAGWREVQYVGHNVHNRLLAVSAWSHRHPRLFRLLHIHPTRLFWRFRVLSGYPVPSRLDARTVDGLLASHLQMIRLLEADPEARGLLRLYRLAVAVLLGKMGLRTRDPVGDLQGWLRARERVWTES